MGRSMQCLVPPFFLLISLVETTVAQRMVYPQAAVGPIAGQEFRIELRLGNRHSDQAWTGKVSFLRQQDLGRMIDLRVEESDGSSQLLAEGSWQVEIAADSSAFYRISSPSLQVGALVIESETGGIENLVTSFYYLLYDPTVQAVTDLIAVQPSTSAALAYSSMISQADNLSVGVAIVAEQGISAALSAGEDLPGVDIGLSVSLENGKKYSAVATLGGGEDGQKALFPDQVIPALPPVFDSARLDVTASSPVYLTLLGVGTPPTFQDVQIGAAPAQATSGTDGGETKDPTGGWDLMTTPVSSTCGPVGETSTERTLIVGCDHHFAVITLDGLWGRGVIQGDNLVFAGSEVNQADFGCPVTLISGGIGSASDSRMVGQLNTTVVFDPESCGPAVDCTIATEFVMTRAAHVISCFDRAVFKDPGDSNYILPYPAGTAYKLNVSYCGVGWGHRDQLAYDFLLPIGDEVVAARSGTVRYVRADSPDDGQGTIHNNVQIEHEDGTVAFYAHLKQFGVLVAVGEEVEAGQRIAYAGHSGTTDVPHLHFGVYENYPPVEGRDLPVNFRNAVGPLDCREGLVMGETYSAGPD